MGGGSRSKKQQSSFRGLQHDLPKIEPLWYII